MDLEAKAKPILDRLIAERTAIAKENQEEPWKANNGLGTLKARISMIEYMMAHEKYKHLYPGTSCWYDPEFVRAYLRDNPECRVKTKYNTNGAEYVR